MENNQQVRRKCWVIGGRFKPKEWIYIDGIWCIRLEPREKFISALLVIYPRHWAPSSNWAFSRLKKKKSNPTFPGKWCVPPRTWVLLHQQLVLSVALCGLIDWPGLKGLLVNLRSQASSLYRSSTNTRSPGMNVRLLFTREGIINHKNASPAGRSGHLAHWARSVLNHPVSIIHN